MYIIIFFYNYLKIMFLGLSEDIHKKYGRSKQLLCIKILKYVKFSF